jgi:putative NADH-flavin reductase
MKIGIIGATGMAGSAAVREAQSRGHQVRAFTRDEVSAREMFGSSVEYVRRAAYEYTREDFAGLDVLIDAFATAPAQAYMHVDLAAHLVRLFRGDEMTRLMFILGAGSLMSGSPKHLFVEDLCKIPSAEAWIAIPQNQLKELKFLREVDDVNWVGISPSADFVEGVGGEYITGDDELLVGKSGKSRVTNQTFARALLDEIESPKHFKRRFTVCDAL